MKRIKLPKAVIPNGKKRPPMSDLSRVVLAFLLILIVCIVITGLAGDRL